MKPFLPLHVQGVRALGLSALDRDLLETIKHISRDAAGCYLVNSQLSKLFEVSVRSIQTSLSKLRNSGLITEELRGRYRVRHLFAVGDRLAEVGRALPENVGVQDSAHRSAENEAPGGEAEDHAHIKAQSERVQIEKREAREALPSSVGSSAKSKADEERRALVDYATEKITGGLGLADVWVNRLFEWVSDRIEPARVKFKQPRKPTKIVNEQQIDRITGRLKDWAVVVNANPDNGDAFKMAIIEAIEEASVNGWSSVHPEKRFEELFRGEVKQAQRESTELVDVALRSVGCGLNNIGARRMAERKIKGRTRAEIVAEGREISAIVRTSTRNCSAVQKLAVLFSGRSEQWDALLTPAGIRLKKEKAGLL